MDGLVESGIPGADGRIDGDTLLQAKGQSYALSELLGGSTALERALRDGPYLTLRLTSGMCHRFRAPLDCRVKHVTYISSEAFNVNPLALKRIGKLFCRNERVVLQCHLDYRGATLVLVLAPRSHAHCDGLHEGAHPNGAGSPQGRAHGDREAVPRSFVWSRSRPTT